MKWYFCIGKMIDCDKPYTPYNDTYTVIYGTESFSDLRRFVRYELPQQGEVYTKCMQVSHSFPDSYFSDSTRLERRVKMQDTFQAILDGYAHPIEAEEKRHKIEHDIQVKQYEKLIDSLNDVTHYE